MFVPAFKRSQVRGHHYLPPSEVGVQIFSNLLKNTVFLSLLRQAGLSKLDECVERLADALAVASIQAASWIALEVFAVSITDPTSQRELLQEVMGYCASGGLNLVTAKERGGSMDGIFAEVFAAERLGVRKAHLAELYADPERTAKLAVALVAIFSSFLNDPEFLIDGIDRTGVRAPTAPARA